MGLSVNGTKTHLHLQVETEPMVSVTNFKVSQITEISEAADWQTCRVMAAGLGLW